MQQKDIEFNITKLARNYADAIKSTSARGKQGKKPRFMGFHPKNFPKLPCFHFYFIDFIWSDSKGNSEFVFLPGLHTFWCFVEGKEGEEGRKAGREKETGFHSLNAHVLSTLYQGHRQKLQNL